MTIQPGDRIPSITLKRLSEDGMAEVKTDDIFSGKTVVMFGVPGAFTPTCSNKHLPGFVEKADAFKAKGVDDIVCMAVNDPFVMKIWGEQSGVGEKVTMLPDGNAELTAALDLGMDGTGAGLGQRCKRFAMVVEDGTVKKVSVDDKGLTETSAEAMLSEL
jgi:peroxiredoxin